MAILHDLLCHRPTSWLIQTPPSPQHQKEPRYDVSKVYQRDTDPIRPHLYQFTQSNMPKSVKSPTFLGHLVSFSEFWVHLQPSPTISNHLQPSPTPPESGPSFRPLFGPSHRHVGRQRRAVPGRGATGGAHERRARRAQRAQVGAAGGVHGAAHQAMGLWGRG